MSLKYEPSSEPLRNSVKYPESCTLNPEKVSRRVLGVAVLRVRLAFVLDWVDAVTRTKSSDPTIFNIPEMISRSSVVRDRPPRENAQVPQTLDTIGRRPFH